MDAGLRKSIYRLLMMVSLAMMTARIAVVEDVYQPSMYRPDVKPAASAIVAELGSFSVWNWLVSAGANSATISALESNAPSREWPGVRPFPVPSFGSNDRSRWATIRALVEDGTFEIGQREMLADGSYRDTGRVFEPGYRSIDKVMNPHSGVFYSSKPPLLTTVLAGEYWLFHRIGLTLETHRWPVMRSMIWTENVLPLAIYLCLFARVVERYGRTDWARLFTYAAACFGTFLTTFATTLNNHVPAAVTGFLAVYALLGAAGASWSIGRIAVCGFFAGLTACFELPATALAAGLFVAVLVNQPRTALLTFLPAALVPVIAQLALNYIALGEVLPAYAKFGERGGWYEYAGSYWARTPREVKRGIDWAIDYESRGTYVFHLLLGHHGIFSLTPIWLMAFAAMFGYALRARRYRPTRDFVFENLLILALFVSIAVIVFYAWIVGTANYGGWTSGARWFFWLIPLWLMALLPATDTLANSRLGRFIGLMCLAVSVFSASYPAWNPWRHPWLYHLLESCGYIPYGK